MPAAGTTLLLFALTPISLVAQDVHDWTVDSSVLSVRLVGVEQAEQSPTGPHVRLNLRNVTQRPISAIVVTDPGGAHVRHDQFGLEPLAPGADYSYFILDPQVQGRDRSIQINAVLFADGGSEGDPWHIEHVEASRLGRTIETERIAVLLDSLGSDDELASADASYVIASVDADPVDSLVARWLEGFQPRGALDARETRDALSSGVHLARDNVIRWLRSPDTTLAALRQRVRALTARQKAELEVMQ